MVLIDEPKTAKSTEEVRIRHDMSSNRNIIYLLLSTANVVIKEA